MRIIKIIYHNYAERISTINVRHICNLSIQKGYDGLKDSYVSISWRGSSEVIQLPTEKAYELYDMIVSCLSDDTTNLEVELINGENGDTIDYKVVEK